MPIKTLCLLMSMIGLSFQPSKLQAQMPVYGGIPVISMSFFDIPIVTETVKVPKRVGSVPNNSLPIYIYHFTIPAKTQNTSSYLEAMFSSNGWYPQWRYPIFTYTHYHPNTAEALGIASGSAVLQLGGHTGPKITVRIGDVIILPAGVGHKQIEASDDFMVVGAYPTPLKVQTNRDDPRDMEVAEHSIAQVPIPLTDPVIGLLYHSNFKESTPKLQDIWRQP